jgi:hypothetical protein
MNRKYAQNKPSPSNEQKDLSKRILKDLDINTSTNYVETLAYFIRFGYLPVRNKSIKEAAKIIASSPWRGRPSEGDIEIVLEKLIDHQLIEFIDDLSNQLVLGLSTTPHFKIDYINEVFLEIWNSSKKAIEARSSIVNNIGWPKQSGFLNDPRKLEEIVQDGATIKLATYHGLTLTPGSISETLLSIVKKYENVNFEILCVNKNPKDDLLEGSDKTEHKRSISTGILLLEKQLKDQNIHDRVKIRTYRDPNDSLLRCFIVEAKDKRIIMCQILVWFHGIDRGFYGRNIELSAGSNLARLCRDYFDRVFSKSEWHGMTIREKASWYYEMTKTEIWLIILVVVTGFVIIHFFEWSKYIEYIFIVLPLFLSLLISFIILRKKYYD